MDIKQVLMEEVSARVTCGNRWMVMGDDGTFIVYEHLPYAKKITVVYEGTDENTACVVLSS